MTDQRKPAERTLSEWLREAKSLDMSLIVSSLVECVIERAAELARREEPVWHKAADAILADAGLKDE